MATQTAVTFPPPLSTVLGPVVELAYAIPASFEEMNGI